jgi:hypothetical protein
MADMKSATQISRQRMRSADTSPKGPQHLATRNAGNRRNLLAWSKHPSRIIYLHVKMWRENAIVAAKKQVGMLAGLKISPFEPGPEDLIGKCMPPRHITADV